MVYKWLDIIQTWLPGWCLLCGAASSGGTGLDLCDGCRQSLPRNQTACARCAQPLARPGICGRCQRQPPPFAGSLAPWVYGPPLDELVLRLKGPAGMAPARTLGRLLAAELRTLNLPAPDLLIPVPLHRDRLRQRGFNQAALLARQLSAGLDIPWYPNLLRKTRESADQRGLNRQQRQRNLRGCFTCRPLPADCHVALVDDVITTGATAWEASRALQAAGAAQVEVWSIARTP
jgi:ComF family protein